MKVALDLTPAGTGRTGVARYARELAAGLAALGVETRPFALGRAPEATDWPAGTRRRPAPLRLVHAAWHWTGRPRAEQLAGPDAFDVDLVHSLDLVAPPSRRPVVMTIHDTAAADHPEWHDPRSVRLQRRRLDQARGAAAVLANSAATAADVARHGVEPGRISVTPLGATAWPAPAPVPGLDRVPPGYVLVLGEVHPRKDVPTVARALGRLDPADTPALVVAGPPGRDESRLAGQAGAAGITLVRLAGLADAALPTLLAGAGLLALPSRAEGFGLPVLEAMAAGVPVVASDLPALAELTDGAALLLPAGDVRAWAEALAALLGDPDRRGAMAERGRRRAAGYTWERTARTTLEAYRTVLERTA